MRCSGLDADLADPDRARRPSLELRSVALEVGEELLLVRVLLPNLADLAADADRHPVGFERPNEGRELRRPQVVLTLLLVACPFREVDERRAVDVDVPIARVDCEPACPADLLGHRLRIRRVLLRVELVVIALDEDGTLPAGSDCARENPRRVIDRSLERVRLLAARE